jgi:hypothetical protein
LKEEPFDKNGIESAEITPRLTFAIVAIRSMKTKTPVPAKKAT